MSLPSFPYHPDPIATGSVVASKSTCTCCGSARGFVYAGPVVGDTEPGAICPWCIANGSAHARFDVAFTRADCIGGGGHWDAVPPDVENEVAHRTPGFSGWQPELWWTHCGDAAQFLGRAGRTELEALGPQAVDAIRESTGLEPGAEWNEFFAALRKDDSPQAYVFRCRHCAALGGYQDCD